MAIINNAHRGSQINLLCLIYRVLRRAKTSMSVDEITNLCRPDTLLRKEDHKKRFPGELQFWMNEYHQLWVINENNCIELTHTTESISPSPLEIGNVVRSALFSLSINDVMKKENEHDTESLLRTLACLLTSGRFLPFGKDSINKQGLDVLLDEFLLSKHSLNDSEKPTLLEYGHFLGFLELQGDGYIVDPTRAVYSHLADIFGGQKSMTIKEFYEKLSKVLPVLDGGVYQNQVKEIMIKKGWIPSQYNVISYGLSHALERLSLDKTIRLDTASDDPQAMDMQLPNKKHRSISNITFTGGQE